jgi:DNA-binding XRE family transcriptional regulator
MVSRREYLELSMSEVARKVGASRWTYRDWERGEKSVPADLLPSLAAALCVSVREIADAVERPDSIRRLKKAAA